MKKKLILMSLMTLMLTGLCSCKKDKGNDSPALGASVHVTVKNLFGTLQKNTTVYMYKDKEVTNETIPADAKKLVITDDTGVAVFSLNFTELNILESQTSLYFAVFYTFEEKTKVAGSTGVTIKRNETKNLDITIPL